MTTIETTGKSLDEAKAKAAQELGVPVSDLKVEILEESKGLFGKATYKIRATAPAPKAKPEPKAKAEPKAKPEPRAKAAKPAPEPAPEPEPEPEPAPATAPAKRGLFGKSKDASAAAPAPAKPVEKAAPKSEPKPAKPARPARAAKPEPVAEEVEAKSEVVATQEDAEKILEIFKGLLEKADLNVTAKISGLSGRYVSIEIDGRDVAHLVGKHGEVLNALQYLLNIIVVQQMGAGPRVTLDGNHYRERREQALAKLATSIAEQVRARGEEAVLDALPAFERRIVHKVLSEIEGVHTYSEGEEPNRRVVIAPTE